MHVGPWELAAFGGLYIGASILAADVGLRMSPNIRTKFPKIDVVQESGWSGFIPLILLSCSGAIFLAHSLGWLSGAHSDEVASKSAFVAPIIIIALVVAILLAKRRPKVTSTKSRSNELTEIRREMDRLGEQVSNVAKSQGEANVDLSGMIGRVEDKTDTIALNVQADIKGIRDSIQQLTYPSVHSFDLSGAESGSESFSASTFLLGKRETVCGMR